MFLDLFEIFFEFWGYRWIYQKIKIVVVGGG